MKIIHAIAVLLLFTVVHVASAHDDAYFDSHPSPHGGQVRMAGPFHLELLMDNGRMTLHVTDHGNMPVPTGNLQAEAIVLHAGGKSRLALTPGETATLTADCPEVQPSNDTLVLLMVKTTDGEQYQARFTPGVPAQADAAAAPQQHDLGP